MGSEGEEMKKQVSEQTWKQFETSGLGLSDSVEEAWVGWDFDVTAHETIYHSHDMGARVRA